MALNKVLDKLRPKTEPKKASEEPSRTSKSSKHQLDGSHGSSCPKEKKLVKVRSTRKAPPKKPPNFMKSTTSNDVKEPILKVLRPLKEDSLEQKECSYSYCSLHGHEQGSLPSLKRFLSSRRRSIKVQKSLKLRGFSPAMKIEDVVNEFFIEIQSNTESFSATSFEDSEDKNSELSVDEIQVINQFLELVEKGSLKEEEEEKDIRKTNSNKLTTESSENSISTSREGDKVKDCSSEVSKSAVKYGNLKRQSSKFRESVDLKHFTVEERKSAEEWTVDFALRKALKRLGSKRKVPLLVAAFETVVPQLSEAVNPKN